jgi:CBS domain containing-hemolysin-like protein
MNTSQAWLLILSLILIVISGLMVSAETAIGRVSRGRIEELGREGDKRAARLLRVLEDRARSVNVLLFLSTIATVTETVLVAYVCEGVFKSWPVGWAMALSVAIMVVISYVALGVAPRTLGRQHADQIALASAGIARFLAALLGPLTSLLIFVGNALTPGKGYREGPFASAAELREFVDMAEASSLIEDDERQMIHSVFELSETFAKEVMVPRTEVVFIERDRTLRQALSLGLRSGFSRIPVIGENTDDIIGLVYLKDVVRRTFEHREAEQTEKVESIMRPAYYVPDSKQADELLRDMQANRQHLAIVIDEYGGTAGIVTIEDVLEEIVGEIADEHDTELPEVIELTEGGYRVSSRMHVDDFAELVGIELDADDEGVDTILGLMGLRLGRVPIAGSEVLEGGWRLTAEQGVGRRKRVGTIHAIPIVSEAPENGADDE